MLSNWITYCLEQGLHEYQADELTSHLNQCLSDWHTWTVRRIMLIYFYRLYCGSMSQWLTSSAQKSPVFLEIINKKGSVYFNPCLSWWPSSYSRPHSWRVVALSRGPTHSLLLLPLICSALQEAADDNLNTHNLYSRSSSWASDFEWRLSPPTVRRWRDAKKRNQSRWPTLDLPRCSRKRWQHSVIDLVCRC